MTSKSILFITRYFPPLDCIASQRMYCWAKYLERQGYRISILTTSKEGQVIIPLSLDTSKFEVCELRYFDPIVFTGIDKRSIPPEGAPSHYSVRGIRDRLKQRCARFYRERMNERMPGRTDLWIAPAIKELRRRKRAGISYDFVVSSYGPYPPHIVGYYAKKLFGATWLADYRDLWVESHVFTGLWPFTILERAIESALVKHADVISTVSDPLKDVLQRKFPLIPVRTIENGFDPEATPRDVVPYFDKTQNKFRIVYTGSLYRSLRDPRPLFVAIQQLLDQRKVARDNFEVLFYGNVVGDLLELIREFGLEGMVRHCGTVSSRDALAIQRSANALLFLEAANPAIGGILTGKLFEYLYVDTPIIGVGIGSKSTAGQLIAQTGAGVVCGEDVALIKQTLEELLEGRHQAKRRYDLIMNYSRERQAERVAQLLEEASRHRVRDDARFRQM